MRLLVIRKIIIASLYASLIIISGLSFYRSLTVKEPLYPGPGVTKEAMLSDYFEPLKGTPGDTPVYIMEGKEKGASILVISGNHPNEISGVLANIIYMEKGIVEQGRLFVITHANNSAFTCGHPGEAYPMRYTIKTPSGERWFRFGDRWTNPVHQWPDPEAYTHYPSGQTLSGFDIRNLNRCYPGRPDGTLTEQIGHAITSLIKEEDIDLTLDYHEAEPMYPIINTIVAHDRAMDVGLFASMNLAAFEDIQIGNEPSPVNLHGLTHRELGDHTETLALLAETGNPIQDPCRGATNEKLLLTGKDEFMLAAAKKGLLFIPYDEKGVPVDVRVGRQVSTFQEIYLAYNELYPEKTFSMIGIPRYADIVEKGVGAYLTIP